VHPPDTEVEPAPIGDLERLIAEVGTFGEQGTHLTSRLEVALGVSSGDVVGGERHYLPHALQDVGDESVLWEEVADAVRRHRVDPCVLSEPE
jgi:hypothetical protein